jgi:hypothetical protein
LQEGRKERDCTLAAGRRKQDYTPASLQGYFHAQCPIELSPIDQPKSVYAK